MYAKRSLVVSMAVLALSISACGGSSQTTSSAQPAPTPETQTPARTSHSPSPVDLVRKTAFKIESDISSSHPEDACQYYTDATREKCITGIAEAKALNIKPSSFLPINWRELFAKATITVNGNTAVMNAVKTNKKDMHFVYVDGQWLIDQK